MKQHLIQKVLVWPTSIRFIHYNLLLCLPLLIMTGKQGWLVVHAWLGLWLLGLLIFRLGLALAGPHFTRVREFWVGPWQALQHLGQVIRGTAPARLGHTPAGGYMVLWLWALLLCQIGLGLLSSSFTYAGPLVHLIGFDWSDQLTLWHRRLPLLIMASVALHVLAVLWSQLRLGESLLAAMFIHGSKPNLDLKAEAGAKFEPKQKNTRAAYDESRTDQASRFGWLLSLALAVLLPLAVVGLGLLGGQWQPW